MIASTIGKTFIEAYNQKFKAKYSAKEFFVEKYYSLFFDHEKYMQWATNSPFVQGLKKGIAPTSAERKLKLDTLIAKIENEPADASIAIGFPSLGLTASTSGQISNLNLPLNADDVYLSWIGSGFGIGVQSGLSMLFDNKQILLDLYEGWQVYRNYLNENPQLRGNQINTWNGQWIAHRYSKNFDARNVTASFDPTDAMKNGDMEMTTQAWTNVLIGIARTYPNTEQTAYIYSLGQTNITIGFIPFDLPRIVQPYDLYVKYFGTSKLEQVQQLFGTADGFTKACQMGAIGVNALEPKGFRDCMTKGVMPKYSNADEEKIINYNTYQIWLLAMLNNETLWEKAERIATILNNHSMSDTNAKTKKSNEIATLLTSVNKKQFIDGLIPVVNANKEVDDLKETGLLVDAMPVDNVPYFLTLIRFHYAILNKK